jgi:hypothetical protein
VGTEQAVHFIEHDPKAEDVAARVNRLPLSLLGRHISNRAEAFRRNHDVPGLGIAMDDPGGVCAGQSVGDLDGVFQNLGQPHPIFRDQPVQRLARHVLHGDEVHPVGLADVVDRDDV